MTALPCSSRSSAVSVNLKASITIVACLEDHKQLPEVSLDSNQLISLSLYDLEKVLDFGNHLEKSFNLVKVLEKYLISLLSLEKSLKFSNLSTPDHF